VGAQVVQGIAPPGVSVEQFAGGVDLRALAPAPHHEQRSVELLAQVQGPHGLLNRSPAHTGVGARERAVAEHGVAEEGAADHGDDHPGVVDGRTELLDDLLLVARLLGRHEVVVVEVDAPDAHLAQLPHDLHGRGRLAGGLAERVQAYLLGDRPQAEAELVVAGRLVHRRLLAFRRSTGGSEKEPVSAELGENAGAELGRPAGDPAVRPRPAGRPIRLTEAHGPHLTFEPGGGRCRTAPSEPQRWDTASGSYRRGTSRSAAPARAGPSRATRRHASSTPATRT